ncbi:RDD family protein [Aeromicrobium ginsengisoli]|uniref:RDD family protein n=1 Tax=Aeromicrobium ginsengisoli TaxID=363867 RepID=A0A5M4FAR2_9ACTN|nr:RDD family protein [Aeromicrobium ginsengisoli]KAA1395448.1 RDD family protein [Aeromicrobium ginsengisoli]
MSQQYYPTWPSSPKFAGWGARVGASILDSVPTLIVFVICIATFGTTDTADGSFSFQLSGAGAAVYYLFGAAWFFYNTVYRQGTTGASLGKSILGITLGRAGSGEPIGAGMSFVRQIVHILDALPCGLGYLWPLWDSEKRTFADMILSTRVYQSSSLSKR